jgi:hypothetical protein
MRRREMPEVLGVSAVKMEVDVVGRELAAWEGQTHWWGLTVCCWERRRDSAIIYIADGGV